MSQKEKKANIKMNTKTCILCNDMWPEDAFSEINNNGIKACPRCIFLIALYFSRGIDKKLTDGCLMPSRLNAEYKRILKEEFYPHPKET